jgi:hypothetical protein
MMQTKKQSLGQDFSELKLTEEEEDVKDQVFLTQEMTKRRRMM